MHSFMKEYKEAIISKDEFKSLLLNKELPLNFIVNDLNDFLRIIQIIENERFVDRTNQESNLLYRGVSDESWLLEPSLSFEGLVPFEEKMINEFIQLRPDDFIGTHSDFDLLSKMQHYGLPTRLLDFTGNPLVALYFSCCNTNYYDKDGKVFICLPRYPSFTIREYVVAPCSTHSNLQKKLLHDEPFYHSYMGIHHSFDSIYFAKPLYISERELRQESVFLIFPNNLCSRDNGSVLSFELGAHINLGFETNDEFVFGNVVIHDSIKSIRPSTLEKQFSYVTIPHEQKGKILRQLQNIGIKESFLFPELEYTAGMIKNKYLDIRKRFDSNLFDERYDL